MHAGKHQAQISLFDSTLAETARLARMPKQPRQIYFDLLPTKPSEVYDTYWYFAFERQEILFRRIDGNTAPWTEDPILARHRFTNVYRAADRVSQFLIRHVIYSGDQSPNELFFRILIFKIFNRIETWQRLKDTFGEVSFRDYSFQSYDACLSEAMNNGHRIFSAAYIMPSGASSFGHTRKHQNFLRLLERMMAEEVPFRIADAPNMQTVFELLRGYPLIGDFLAYQYAIDLNYSALTDFSENSFVVPGPGAKNGIRKCFVDYGGLSEIEIIRMMVDRQEREFGVRGLAFRTLFGRPLHLIDCQNLFCEVDKYARIAHPHVAGLQDRTRIKQTLHPRSSPVDLWFPPKWQLNQHIEARSVNP
jgi:hypothetical protein